LKEATGVAVRIVEDVEVLTRRVVGVSPLWQSARAVLRLAEQALL
jgi:hypothetical protein